MRFSRLPAVWARKGDDVPRQRLIIGDLMPLAHLFACTGDHFRMG